MLTNQLFDVLDTACCKNAHNGQFYLFNDENVKQASSRDLSVRFCHCSPEYYLHNHILGICIC